MILKFTLFLYNKVLFNSATVREKLIKKNWEKIKRVRVGRSGWCDIGGVKSRE